MTYKIPVNEDNFNRLAKCLMEKYNCTYEDALERLHAMQINLVCGNKIRNSMALQAALLTAVNTGKRAFLGGVNIVIPPDVASLVRWPNNPTLNQIVQDLGASVCETPTQGCFTIFFGLPSVKDDQSLEVICNGWQGGILSDGEEFQLQCSDDHLPVGGVAAGSLAIGTAFLVVSGVSPAVADRSIGISLWRPDLNWRHEDASGPPMAILPQKYWLLGLGHLGQAFTWNIGLLPYRRSTDVSVWLQDDDRITESNRSGGLISEINNETWYKTRACAAWLEAREFQTKIVERRFDEHTRRTNDEPFIALCGFDKAEGRRALEKAGFDLIVEVALSGTLSMFDNIILHTFPGGRRSPEAIWSSDVEGDDGSEIVRKQFAYLSDNGCGVMADNLSKTAISTSFVGAFAGALAISELLRALCSNKGRRYDTIVAQIRDLENKRVVGHTQGTYKSELAANGFVQV